jgi:4-hydroxy-3-methylbut-2-enyl diphosphate reductase
VLVSRIADITPALLGAATTVGLTAGASTPDRFVREAIARLGELGFETLEQRVVAEETLRFPLPRRLRAKPEKPEQT